MGLLSLSPIHARGESESGFGGGAGARRGSWIIVGRVRRRDKGKCGGGSEKREISTPDNVKIYESRRDVECIVWKLLSISIVLFFFCIRIFGWFLRVRLNEK